MLQVNNIEVCYMSVIQVLRGVSLEVGDNQIVALLGANGGGKTTTLRAISGLLKSEDGDITGGTITLDGQRIDGFEPEAIARLRVSQVMEGRHVLEHLTVEENLMVGAFLRKERRAVQRDMETVFSYFPRVKQLRNRTSGYLSGGEQQMLVIGRAMMANPRLMLLDEPSLGLAPRMVQDIYATIKRINVEQQVSILLVEQNVQAALSIADYAYVMENGKIVMNGPADKLKNNEDVKEFYMGLSAIGERKSYRNLKHYHRRKRWLA